MHQGSIIQGNVFQIGASCGVVIEFMAKDALEAAQLRETVQTALTAALDSQNLQVHSVEDVYELDGMSLNEVFEQVAKAFLRSK